ncbi:Transcriptional repressor protein, KorB [Corchorus olitorius]|uniref:Transcriptional repressor protein, KorB n=1 Tax=Corchorus olitorius TaxID=93759 RepID=A0A1R3L273_9ROSI|nr:Transcriptional repressor protein, KorB [Corchorus olitorius]
MTGKTRVPTSLRSLAELREAQAKNGEDVRKLGRLRQHTASPLEISYDTAKNIRPIDWDVVQRYKERILMGEMPPAIDVRMENGQITLVHGYHRTLAVLAAIKEQPELADTLHLALREFVGNSSEIIFHMLGAQDSLGVDPVSRAEAYRSLLNQGNSKADIARRRGKSAEHVTSNLLLCEAEQEVKNAIRQGRIRASSVIALIKDEKQGGPNHLDEVRKMLATADALGKASAMPKHRNAAPKPATAPRLKLKDVTPHLASLVSISGSLRTALGEQKIDREALEQGQAEVLVPVSLPAGKLLELLDLLDKQSASQTPEEETDPPTETQDDLFNKA